MERAEAQSVVFSEAMRGQRKSGFAKEEHVPPFSCFSHGFCRFSLFYNVFVAKVCTSSGSSQDCFALLCSLFLEQVIGPGYE